MKVPVLIAILLAACIQDLLYWKISNRLILSGAGLSLAFRFCEAGWTGIGAGLIGLLAPVLLFGLCYVMHALGAGDVKLFSLIGGYLGIRGAIHCFLASILIGGAYALIHILYKRKLIHRVRYLAYYFKKLSFIRQQGGIPVYEADADCMIHFTIPILISVLLWTGGVI